MPDRQTPRRGPPGPRAVKSATVRAENSIDDTCVLRRAGRWGVSDVAEAGGIVVRSDDGGTPQFLVVTAKDNPTHWIFPMGHIEHGESAEDAAVREVLEETGIEATPRTYLGTTRFSFKDTRVQISCVAAFPALKALGIAQFRA